MNKPNTHKTVFITGAGQGIGYATAVKFARGGWKVCATDISPTGLAALEKEIGQEHTFAALDVTDSDAVGHIISSFCEANGGQLGCLVNNAGILFNDHFENIPINKHQQLVDVNIRGVLNCSHVALPFLKQTNNSIVINLGSASADFGIPSIASYSASKFFVKGLSQALAVEWKRFGIHVAVIMPHFVATNMTKGDLTTLFTSSNITITAQDVSEKIWQAANNPHKHIWRVENFAIRVQRIFARVMPIKLVHSFLAKSSGY